MRKLQSLFLLFSACCLIFFSKTARAAEKVGSVTFIVGVTGDVQVKRTGNNDWQNAKLNMDVLGDDLIRTKKESRCEITLLDKSVLRIGEQTEFQLTSANITRNQKNVKGVLSKGKIWSNVTRLRSQREEFQIKTPTAVCAVRGTVYRIDADSSTALLVYDGEVDVGPAAFWTMPPARPNQVGPPQEVPGPTEVPGPFEVTLDEWVRIVRGYQIIVRPDGRYAKSRFNVATDNRIEWVQWNKARDQQLDENR